ncbi:unnamed protein product, partial [Adineta ricciae]
IWKHQVSESNFGILKMIFNYDIIESVTTVTTCTIISVNSSNPLWSTSTRVGFSSYTCLMFSWISSTTSNVTLAFRMRSDPGYWFLDDVSVTKTGIEQLQNGGFETGSLFPWIRTKPNGTCSGRAGNVTNNYGLANGGLPHTGNYFINDGSTGCFDQIGQNFTINSGISYLISFWLKASNHTNVGTVFVGVVIL